MDSSGRTVATEQFSQRARINWPTQWVPPPPGPGGGAAQAPRRTKLKSLDAPQIWKLRRAAREERAKGTRVPALVQKGERTNH